MHDNLGTPSPPTQKGRERRQRIVDAAADLIFERGVAEVSLDDIRQVTGVSKSQLYHYFNDKSDLLHAVIECQQERVLGNHRPTFDSLEDWDDLSRWRDMIVAHVALRLCKGGCPLGSLANGLAELDEVARDQLSEAFSSWGRLIAEGLTRMVDSKKLRADADPQELSVSVLASLQGGLLMAETARDTRPLEVALDAAIAHLKSFAP
jgi:AcrR family transcriptional regulator